MFELRDKETIKQFNQKAYQFYLKHRYDRNWFGKLYHTKLFWNAKLFLMDLNKQANNGILTCSFCKEEIEIKSHNYGEVLIHYVYIDKDPKTLFSPTLNMLLHYECLQKIKTLKNETERMKQW